MRVSGFTMRRAERQLDQTLESQTQTSRRKIAIVGDGFGARAAAKEADDGVPGSQRAERPEFEGSHEERGAGKRGVRTFHCTLPRLAANSTLSMRTDFLVGTGPKTESVLLLGRGKGRCPFPRAPIPKTKPGRLHRRVDTPHREATVTAPLLDSTHLPIPAKVPANATRFS
jgi:hypothetical protein